MRWCFLRSCEFVLKRASDRIPTPLRMRVIKGHLGQLCSLANVHHLFLIETQSQSKDASIASSLSVQDDIPEGEEGHHPTGPYHTTSRVGRGSPATSTSTEGPQ